MHMPSPDILAIIAVGIALAALILRGTARIDRHIAEAGRDRRAHQASMDDFRKEMLRLAERQAHVEGSSRTLTPAG